METEICSYLSNVWWNGWLGKTFPTYYGFPNSLWGIKIHNFNLLHYRFSDYYRFSDSSKYEDPFKYSWYSSEVAAVGYKYKKLKRPDFWIFIPESKLSIFHEFNMEDAENDLQILEAISNPTLLPLCLNSWAEPVMVNYFNRKKEI